ncbi:MAG: hypothetical protein GY913_23380 [Proteobacteria bacterium]|nr:hypothetical protein [Pseudomonadota bacterium]MCP4919855.1 hypothetical protein [Pseudomonadota bacterium]
MSTDIQGISGISDASALDQSTTQTFGGQDLDQSAFMNLLTTQMQNQDPLDPMANEEFIAQLATFSSLEQLMNLNSIAQTMTLGISSLNNAAMVDLVGMDIVAAGDEFHYSGEGDQELMYDAEGAGSATLNVYDEDGKVVFTESFGIEEGEGSYTWDGKGTDGGTLPEGDYTFSVTATDTNGDEVEVAELIHGVVDEMDFSTGTPQPSINGVAIDLADLIRLSTQDSADEEGGEETT